MRHLAILFLALLPAVGFFIALFVYRRLTKPYQPPSKPADWGIHPDDRQWESEALAAMSSFDRWLWADGPMYPPPRDPREDDPEYYRRSGRWIRRTVWTVENAPDCSNHKEYMRFLEETTPEERSLIRAERRRRYDQEQEAKGLVRWQNAWVTPERRDELKKTYEENRRRSAAGLQLARRMRSGSDRWLWC